MTLRPFVLCVVVILSFCPNANKLVAQERWEFAGHGLTGVVQTFYDAPNGDFLCGTTNGIFQTRDSGSTWTQLGWNDNFLRGISSITETSTGDIFAGGAGVFRSTSQGQSWQLLKLESIWAVMTAPGNVLLACNDSGVFRSTDNGNSWACMTSSLSRLECRALAFSPNGYVFVATGSRGIFRSSDSGLSWASMGNGIGKSSLYCLTCDSTGVLLTAGKSFGNSMFRSTDNGVSWQKNRFGNCSALSVIDDTVVVAGTPDDGIFMSQDHGLAWHPINSNLNYKTRWFPAVASYRGRLFASVNEHGVGVSTDYGTSWRADTNYLLNPAIATMTQNSVGTLFVSTWNTPVYASSIMRSVNGGQTWEHADNGLKYPGSLLAATQNYLFEASDSLCRSSDEGRSWQRVAPAVNAMVEDTKHSLVAVSDSVYRSSDTGATWQGVPLPWKNNSFAALAADSLGILYASVFPGATSTFGTVARSSNDGTTWQIADTNIFTEQYPNDTIRISKLLVSKRGTVFAASTHGLGRSTDQGLTWNVVMAPDVLDIAVDSSNNIYALFFGSPSFLSGSWLMLRSTDDGKTWWDYSTGMPTDISSNYGALCVGRTGIFLGLPVGVFKIEQAPNSDVKRMPPTYHYSSAFPNPATSNFSVTVSLQQPTEVRVDIANVAGSIVYSNSTKLLDAGEQSIAIDRSNLTSGTYLVILQYDGKRITTPVMLY
jgi:photosystem II stability/assembly factor-like uncharacterized protein